MKFLKINKSKRNKEQIMYLINIFVTLSLVYHASASTLAMPPHSALIVAFEDTYDLSLLANTLSDLGIDSKLIVLSSEKKIYEHLIEVEILRVNGTVSGAENTDVRALEACKALLSDENIFQKIEEIQPTFTILPALRHDGCLLPWVKFINSIPVIWARGFSEELYAFDQTKIALPFNTGGFFSTLFANINLRMLSNSARNNYIRPALQLVSKHLPNVDNDIDNLYSSVNLVLWGMDSILRMNAASLSQLFVEVGCHHCRGPQPLPPTLQKQVINYKAGVVVVTLDKTYITMIQELALKIPQGYHGLCIVWKIKELNMEENPENLFIHKDVDRQDLIGFSRTRLLLSHCSDTELLETVFHGTPVLCFPRNPEESTNTVRAVELGFSLSMQNDGSSTAVASAILQLHETAGYRENARKVSLAIRDRPIPAMDRLLYWLSYVARIKGEDKSLLSPRGSISTYAEAFQWMFGFFIGMLFSVLLTVMYFFARFITERERLPKHKGKYERKLRAKTLEEARRMQ